MLIQKSSLRSLALWLAPIFALAFVAHPDASAQNTSHGRNYDESEVRPYTVPDPLVAKDGSRARNAAEWRAVRQPEIHRDFRDLMYGHTPDFPFQLRTEVIATRNDAVKGLATRKIVRLRFFDDPDAPHIDLMLYTPN